MILNRKHLTTLLGILTCVLLVMALLKWSNHYRAKLEAEQALAAGQVTEDVIPLSLYNKLSYYNGSTTSDFLLKDGKWVWAADQNFPLNDATIQTILAQLENLQPLQTMEAPADLEEYDLGSSPAATLTASGDTVSLSLIFGKETDGGGRYVIKDGDDSTIYIMPSTLLEPMSVPIYDMMILPQVPSIDPTRVDFIRIFGKTKEDGSYETYTILTAQRPELSEGETLTAEDVIWLSNGANVTKNSNLQELLANLATLSIEKCLDYNPSEEAVTHCGFDLPIATLKVEFHSESGAEQSLKLIIGNAIPDGSGRYVRYGDDDPTLYRMSNTTLDALLRITEEGVRR